METAKELKGPAAPGDGTVDGIVASTNKGVNDSVDDGSRRNYLATVNAYEDAKGLYRKEQKNTSLKRCTGWSLVNVSRYCNLEELLQKRRCAAAAAAAASAANCYCNSPCKR